MPVVATEVKATPLKPTAICHSMKGAPTLILFSTAHNPCFSRIGMQHKFGVVVKLLEQIPGSCEF